MLIIKKMEALHQKGKNAGSLKNRIYDSYNSDALLYQDPRENLDETKRVRGGVSGSVSASSPVITHNPISESKQEGMIDLFNYYIEHSFAAHPEQKVLCQFFSLFLQACNSYPLVVAKLPGGELPAPALRHSHSRYPNGSFQPC